MEPGGQLTTTTEIENFPGFEDPIDASGLVETMRKQAARFGARFEFGEVTSCDLGGKPLTLTIDGSRVIEARTVIIATGASARYLGLDSEQKLMGRGVSGCATCDGAFCRGQSVAVVGGGDTAMEDALFLSRIADKVTLIHRRDEFRASRIMADRVKENEKIDIKWDSVVEDVLGVDQNEVTGLRLKNVKTGALSELAVTGVFMAIGHTPNTGPFAEFLDLDAAGYAVADHTRTTIEGVYAAGDVQDAIYRQAVTAAGSGCMAALEVERYLSVHG